MLEVGTLVLVRAFACRGERVGKFPGAEKFPEEVLIGANIQITFLPIAVRSVISPLCCADRRSDVEST